MLPALVSLHIHRTGIFDELFCGILTTVEHHVLKESEQIFRNVFISHLGRRIDDGKVHACTDGMIEENGVHRLADVIVATEGEREVRDATADVRPRQVLANPAGGPDEVEGIAVVLLHARCNGQDVGVEDNVMGIHAHLFRQQAISPLGNLDAALVGRGLPLFIEAHDDDGGPKPLHVAGMAEEDVLALLERDAVDDRLALDVLQGVDDDVPLARVDHHGHAGNVGLGGDEAQETGHLLTGVEQGVVHVDIDDQRAVLHLLAGYLESLLVVVLLDEPQELT